MTSGLTPHGPAASQPPVPGVSGVDDGRWMHELRNELSTAMMSAAAARRLLQHGAPDEALANVRRVESACHRCAQLLNSPRPTRPQ